MAPFAAGGTVNSRMVLVAGLIIPIAGVAPSSVNQMSPFLSGMVMNLGSVPVFSPLFFDVYSVVLPSEWYTPIPGVVPSSVNQMLPVRSFASP